MNNVATFIKQNPIIIACIVVMLLAVGYIIYQTQVMEPEFQKKADEYKTLTDNLNRLKNTTVELPPSEAGGETTTKKALINKAAIDNLKDAFDKINAYEKRIEELVIQRNKVSHSPMLSGIFPTIRPGVSTNAKSNLSRYIYDRYNMINAKHDMGRNTAMIGLPPTLEEINAKKQEYSQSYRQQWSVDALSPLSEERELLLKQKLRNIHLQMIQDRANKFPVYMKPMEFDRNTSRIVESGAFANVPNWLSTPEVPRDDIFVKELWQQQRIMWVFEDIIRIVEKANNGSATVPTSVVKQISAIKVDGADLMSGNNSPTNNRGALPKKVTLAFGGTPTGRTSNEFYMVRKAEVTLRIDAAKKKEFFNAIAETNLITPKIISITNVDDAKMLEEGFFYGDCDVIEIKLELETLWFNEWMKALMPQELAISLGLAKPATPSNP